MDFKASIDKMDDILENINPNKKKKNKLKRTMKVLKIFLGIVFSCLIIILVLVSFVFFKYKHIYDSALLGKASLEYSLSNARRGDFIEMIDAATRAEGYFNDILVEVKGASSNMFLNFSGFTRSQVADLEYLTESASIISRSFAQAGEIVNAVDEIISGQTGEKFSEFSPEQKILILKKIYESGPELNGVKANLELALLNLDKIKANALFLPAKSRIEEAKIELEKGVDILSKLVIVSQLAPEIFGYPTNSTFLVLFQNNSELRPTGGFLGTYGILETRGGDIVRFDTHDIYHMDMPMETGKLLSVTPPKPIKDYLNKNWYMRDSNWSPDWPTSARQIDWFYHTENELLPEDNKINDFDGEFSGIIAITPELVEDILSLVGPIEVSGETYSPDNFTDLLQYKVEQDFLNQNISSWERKELIGIILEKLKIEMMNLHHSSWPLFAEIIEKNIAEKNILAYFNDESLESLIKDLGVSGEMVNVDGDYLMIVDSNMGALKTDPVVDRDVKYEVEERSDKLIAKLELNYKNNGIYDWRTGDYHSYTRIYAPKGSKLIKAEGIKGKVDIDEEFDRVYFGGFFSAKVGKEANIKIEYELPKKLHDDLKNGYYKLYIQKQPGKELKSLSVDFKAISEVKSYNPIKKSDILNVNEIKWISDLKTDESFEINF